MSKKQELIDVMSYRSGEGLINTVYVGGMATADVTRALGGSYGHDTFNDLIETATSRQIAEAWKVVESTIKYMKAHPVIRCNCCGQIVPASHKQSTEG